MRYQNQELLDILRKYKDVTREVPSSTKWLRLCQGANEGGKGYPDVEMVKLKSKMGLKGRNVPNTTTYIAHFNGWSNALRKAGLYPKGKKTRKGRSATFENEYLLRMLQEAYAEYGRRLSVSEWEKFGAAEIKRRGSGVVGGGGLSRYPSPTIYMLRFGSWGKAWGKAKVPADKTIAERRKEELENLRTFKRLLDECVTIERKRVLEEYEKTGVRMTDPRPEEKKRDKLRRQRGKLRKQGGSPKPVKVDTLFPLRFAIWDYAFGSLRNVQRVNIAPKTYMVKPFAIQEQISEVTGKQCPKVHYEFLVRHLDPKKKLSWKGVVDKAGFKNVQIAAGDGEIGSMKKKLREEVLYFQKKEKRNPKPIDFRGDNRMEHRGHHRVYSASRSYYRVYERWYEEKYGKQSPGPGSYNDKWEQILRWLGINPCWPIEPNFD